MLRRRLLTGLLAAATAMALTVGLAACSGDTKAKVTPDEALATARTRLVDAKFVKLALSSKDMPADRNGVSEAVGTGEFSATEPKFQGTIQGRVTGITANLEIIAIGDGAWWKLFTPEFTVADLKGVGAPNPSGFFHPETGLPKLVSATTALSEGKAAREGKEVLTTYAGTLPGAPIKDLLMLGDGTGSFDVTFGVTEQGELRKVVITGPFFEGTTSTYTLLLTDYGTPATITAPL